MTVFELVDQLEDDARRLLAEPDIELNAEARGFLTSVATGAARATINLNEGS